MTVPRNAPWFAPFEPPPVDPSAARVQERLHLAGFTVVAADDDVGGVEIRTYDDPEVGVLVSWAPHPDSFEPIDPQLVEVEAIMTDTLVRVLRALGFDAERFGASYRVRVTAGAR